MKTALVSLMLVSGLVLASNAEAAPDVQKIMGAHGCLSCHSLDQTLVGPSFKMVAAKYHGKKGVVKILAHKVITGGAGNWTAVTGGAAMPPHPNLPMPQAEEVVKWILAQK